MLAEEGEWSYVGGGKGRRMFEGLKVMTEDEHEKTALEHVFRKVSHGLQLQSLWRIHTAAVS